MSPLRMAMPERQRRDGSSWGNSCHFFKVKSKYSHWRMDLGACPPTTRRHCWRIRGILSRNRELVKSKICEILCSIHCGLLLSPPHKFSRCKSESVRVKLKLNEVTLQEFLHRW